MVEKDTKKALTDNVRASHKPYAPECYWHTGV